MGSIDDGLYLKDGRTTGRLVHERQNRCDKTEWGFYFVLVNGSFPLGNGLDCCLMIEAGWDTVSCLAFLSGWMTAAKCSLEHLDADHKKS